jgi:propanol-preferring alcohol dehydrogenase
VKAQVLHKIELIENKPLVYESYADPITGHNELMIRVKACGVCHSNIHSIEGEWQKLGVPGKLPIIPGHEIVGVVEEAGREVEGFSVGEKVGVQPLYDSCGKCEYCQGALENLCVKQRNTGDHVDGGFAEFVKVPYEYAYHVPEGLGFEESAPLFCAGVTAYRSIRRAGVTIGHTVAVFGIGGVGHLSMQFAKLAGANVIAIDTAVPQLAMAEEYGADYAVLPEELDSLVSKTGRPHVVVVHAPFQNAVDQAVKVVKRGGTILLAVFGSPRLDFSEEYTLVTSTIGTRNDMNETLKIGASRKIRVKHTTYPLSEANHALLELKKGRIVGRAVLIP